MDNKNKTKIELLNDLYNAWQGAFPTTEKYNEENEYLATADKDVLKTGVKLSHFYHTHVVPLPFWGNIYDPKYIVLSHNPSCEPIVDELESHWFYEMLKRTLTKPWLSEKTKEKSNDQKFIKEWLENNWQVRLKEYSINWLNQEEFYLEKKLANPDKQSKRLGSETLKNKELKNGYTTTYDWWNEVFDNFNESDRENIFEEVGFFNLCGYHSRSYVEVPQKYLSKDYLDEIKKENESMDNKNIPTIRATIKYVQHLIKTDSKLKVILIWGTEWKDYIRLVKEIDNLEKDNRLLIVNKKVEGNSTRNKVINANIINYYDKKYKEYEEKNKENWSNAFFKVFPGWKSIEKSTQ